RRELVASTAADGVDERLVSDHAAGGEPPHEDLRVVVRRVLPRGAVEPEGPIRNLRKIDVLAIDYSGDPQLRHVRAEPEADAEPFAVGRTLGVGGVSLGTAHGHPRPAIDASDDHFPMARGDGREPSGARAA